LNAIARLTPPRRRRRPIAATSELVPLMARVQWLGLVRVLLATLTMVASVSLHSIVPASLTTLAVATALYLAAETSADLVRLRTGGDRHLLTVMLLVDGVYLAYVANATGGQSSILRSLITLHLVAVILLVSYRTGLKVAAWHLILLFALQQIRGEDFGDAKRTLAFGVSVLLIGAGTATFSAVNERELRRRRSDVEALHDFAVALDHARHTGDLAEVLAQRATHIAGLTSCLVISHRAGAASILAATGKADVQAGDPVEIGPDSVIAEAWTRRQTLLVRELDPERDPVLDRWLPNAVSVAVFPLFSDGLPAGVLVGVFGQTQSNRVERSVIATVEQLAAHASLALRNAWLLHDVEELAVTDDLTRLANRRQFETALTNELALAKAHGTTLGFILVDLDRFKSLNDTHGHLTGDEVLRRVSDVLVGVTEIGDTVARYGGEEFAMVLPGRDPMATAAIAERARLAIAALGSPVPVTASFGACSYPADATDGPALMRAADEAMYESKRAGRNRVTSAAGRASGWLDLPWRAVDWDAERHAIARSPAPEPALDTENAPSPT
jgi:two-component system, cell cycle response regulator